MKNQTTSSEERVARQVVVIDVSQRDIDLANVPDCDMCPVEIALVRKGFHRPIAGYSTIDIGTSKNRRELKTPKKVSEFMIRFDADQRVKPFEFQLEVTK